jgi:hypothetical protein
MLLSSTTWPISDHSSYHGVILLLAIGVVRLGAGLHDLVLGALPEADANPRRRRDYRRLRYRRSLARVGGGRRERKA